jgi:hypothetical protein
MLLAAPPLGFADDLPLFDGGTYKEPHPAAAPADRPARSDERAAADRSADPHRETP